MTACKLALISISLPGLPAYDIPEIPSVPEAPPLGIPLRRPTITIAPPGAPVVGLAVPVVTPPAAPPLGIQLRPPTITIALPGAPSFGLVALPDPPSPFCPLD